MINIIPAGVQDHRFGALITSQVHRLCR